MKLLSPILRNILPPLGYYSTGHQYFLFQEWVEDCLCNYQPYNSHPNAPRLSLL